MSISNNIFTMMKEKNISQKKLSDLTGISKSTINDWKKKGTNPGADKILPLCKALEVTP